MAKEFKVFVRLEKGPVKVVSFTQEDRARDFILEHPDSFLVIDHRCGSDCNQIKGGSHGIN